MTNTGKHTRNARTEENGRKLVLPLALEDGQMPAVMQRLSLLIIAIVFGFLAWAYFAQIREYAVAQGEIVPSGSIKSVHHLEGGIIDKVLIREGDVVERDQPIILLRPLAEQSDLAQLQYKRQLLQLRKDRIQSLLRDEDFAPDLLQYHNELVTQQADLFSAQKSLHRQEMSTHQARIEARISEMEALAEEAAVVKASMDRTTQHHDSLQALFEKRLVARTALEDAANKREEAAARYVGVMGRLNAARTGVAEARSLAAEAQVKRQETLTNELNEVAALLAEVDQELAKQADRVDRLRIRAPVRGTIQSLAISNAGEVLMPGQMVASIVPSGEEMMAVVRLDPSDIGHIENGDPVEITLSTFDANQFGFVNGEVEQISATTFQSEDGHVYYEATIRLARDHVGRGATRHAISPGMVVNANIITGAKSLTQYLLKPIYGSLRVAFSER